MDSGSAIMEQLNGVRVSKDQAPFIHRRIERLAARAGIAKPTVHVIHSDLPNALAAGISANDMAVAVTTALLKDLDEDELEAVLAHEIAHIQRGHSVVKTQVAMRALTIDSLANVAGAHVIHSDVDFTPGDDDSDDLGSSLVKIGLGSLVAATGSAIAGGMLTDISHSIEFEADEAGAILSGKPWALASALARLETLMATGKDRYPPEVSQLFIVSPAYLHYETHPETSARIGKLHEMGIGTPATARIPTSYCATCGEKTDSDGRFCYWCGTEQLG